MADIELIGLRGLPRVMAGDDLAGLLAAALERQSVVLRAGDVLVVCQKVVSKSEGREVDLSGVEPSARAREIAGTEGDPRVVELVLRESARIVRQRGSFLVVETRHGYVCAAAGVDRSNTSGDDRAILLPLDPDASARRLSASLGVPVIVSDSFGRPFRQGTTGVAVGCHGVEPIEVRTGHEDDRGRPFHGTEIHIADQIATAAELLMGPAGGVPAVVVRGAPASPGTRGAAATVIPAERDLFR